MSLARSAGAFVALSALTLASALLVAAAPGLAARLREWFAFSMAVPPRGADRALAAWVANARVAALVLLAALAARSRARPLLDGLLALVVGANVGLVGAALGAYGPRLAPWIAHLPLEWAGLAVALGAYLNARAAAPSRRALLQSGALVAGLLAAGAVVEVWATPLLGP